VGGRAADTARRASPITFRSGDTLYFNVIDALPDSRDDDGDYDDDEATLLR